MKRKLSNWSKTVKKEMIDRDMDVNDVAAKAKWTRQYTSAIINGRMYQREAVITISRLLNIDIPTGSTLATEHKKEEPGDERNTKMECS